MARKATRSEQAALEAAQQLVYDAWEAGTAKRRIALAEKAIATSPLCADAYVLLAEHGKADSDETFEFWRQGVEAGRQALGASFEEFEGEFWGWHETRPYMRARFGLAHALWRRGRHDEAISHLQAMLVLNPNDNQGVRYILSAWLIETDQDSELAKLLARYPEDGMATWPWTTALSAFRRDGDNAESRQYLTKALAENKHIPAFLLGDKTMPKSWPPFMSPGQPDEAIHYVREFAEGWRKTQGALDWLRARTPAPEPAAKRKAKPAG